MIIPETPITQLDSRATTEDIINKINEIINAINTMWNPSDGSA
jgi:hypothetical protein